MISVIATNNDSIPSVELAPHLLSVTLPRLSVSSSLQITNRSFRPHLWNQLPSSFRQPHFVHSPPGSPHSVHYHLITETNFALTIYHSLGIYSRFKNHLKSSLSIILSSVVTLIPSGLPSRILNRWLVHSTSDIMLTKWALAFVLVSSFS